MPYCKRAFGEEQGSILPGEYTALEQLGQRAADRLRRSQAEQQPASGLVAASIPSWCRSRFRWAEALNRRVQVTSMVTSKTPWQVWVDHITGKAPLYAKDLLRNVGSCSPTSDARVAHSPL